ncbi:hypothetical protein B484DRAFT_143302 [Ochromonadaceae sp. CCMP2298]|nr:hypothetical protein B484DRAFT_143302 [Ochromonadaceae sp. CCMP2298]
MMRRDVKQRDHDPRIIFLIRKLFEPARQEDILAAALTTEYVSLADVQGMLVSLKSHDDNVLSRSDTGFEAGVLLRMLLFWHWLEPLSAANGFSSFPDRSAPEPIVCEYSCDDTYCDFKTALLSVSPAQGGQGVLSEEDWVVAKAVFGIMQANQKRFDPRAKAGFLLTPSLIMRNREQPAGPVCVISKAELRVLAAAAVRENLVLREEMLFHTLLDDTCTTLMACYIVYNGAQFVRGKGFQRFGAVTTGVICVSFLNMGYIYLFKRDGWIEQRKQQGSIVSVPPRT